MQRLSDGEILIVGSFLSGFEDICYLAWLSRDDLFFKAANKLLNSKKSICLSNLLNKINSSLVKRLLGIPHTPYLLC